MGSNANDVEFTEEMHMRSSLLAAEDLLGVSQEIGLVGNEGMFRHTDSVATEQSELLEKEIELKLLHRTLAEIDKIANKRVRDGFNETRFTCGVLNCICVAFVFGAYPQHFWIVYLVEGLVLMSTKFYTFACAKPLNNAFYFFDFCWVMNLVFVLALLLFSFDGIIFSRQLSEKAFFLTASGMACGPLLGACLVLPFVCLLFHDVSTMADLFIHIFPPMLIYTILWDSEDLKKAWPNVFFMDYLDEVEFFPVFDLGTIAGNALAFYLLWFVLYTLWMLLVGINMPRNDLIGRQPKFDTVFHSLMRGGLCVVIGWNLWRRPKDESLMQMKTNHFEFRDFMVYMIAHAILVGLSIFVLGYLCFKSQTLHAFFLILVTTVTAHRGAQRYTYYTTAMYGKMIRKEFADIMVRESSE